MDEALDESVKTYIARLADPAKRAHACRATNPEELAAWQAAARPALRRLLGLETMEADLAGHTPRVELGDVEDVADHTRRFGRIETEPGMVVPFWLLEPKTEPPHPLALTPHGHGSQGYDTYVGLPRGTKTAEKIAAEDRDVAVQAVRRGYVTIAPATRGIGCGGVPDLADRHQGRHCNSSARYAILAGRTCLGERVWDMARLIDCALARDDVVADNLLILGNSGGGMVTFYAAACDPRIQMAAPSCCFSLFVRADGQLSHCPCNTVPGILRFGEFHDVAGLIAPRGLCNVSGREDKLHEVADIERAVAELHRIYTAAGAADGFVHHFGDGGHRFYKDLFWPEIDRRRTRSREASS